MIYMRRLILTMIALLCFLVPVAQESRQHSIDLYFRQGKSKVEERYQDNSARMTSYIDTVEQLMSDRNKTLQGFTIESSASPEGPLPLNERLSRERAESALRYLRRHIAVADSQVTLRSLNIDWDGLIEKIESDTNKTAELEAALEILNSTPERAHREGREINERNRRLQNLQSGNTWRYLYRTYFPDLRAASIHLIYTLPPESRPTPTITPLPTANATLPAIAQPGTVTLPRIPAGALYVKTDVPALALLILNAGVEYCFADEQFSVNLPIYYSAIDYFSHDLKFRTFAVQPSFRWWIPRTRGMYVGVHAGLAYYNFAFKGELRYQDHAGRTPALGGGIEAGYRLALEPTAKWNLEFHIGCGVYDLYYDTFYNIPNGRLSGSVKDTYFGIDRVGISLSYRFNLYKHPTR